MNFLGTLFYRWYLWACNIGKEMGGGWCLQVDWAVLWLGKESDRLSTTLAYLLWLVWTQPLFRQADLIRSHRSEMDVLSRRVPGLPLWAWLPLLVPFVSQSPEKQNGTESSTNSILWQGERAAKKRTEWHWVEKIQIPLSDLHGGKMKPPGPTQQ